MGNLEWISFEERMPKENELVWMVSSNDEFSLSVEDILEENFLTLKCACQGHNRQLTHWLPKPKFPPKKRWVPKKGEPFWLINIYGGVIGVKRGGGFKEVLNYSGFYRTEKEAKDMALKIANFVKNEIGEAP